MKRSVLLALALPSALALAGCSTQLTDNQVAAMNKETFRIQCEAGCNVAYTDPRDRPRLPTNGWDTANTAINAAAGVVTSTAPWAAIGLTAAKGISQAGGNDNSVQTSSDNSVQASNTDNSVRLDTTHTPTVVNQPAPTIVEQPAPVVVQQPVEIAP